MTPWKSLRSNQVSFRKQCTQICSPASRLRHQWVSCFFLQSTLTFFPSVVAATSSQAVMAITSSLMRWLLVSHSSLWQNLNLAQLSWKQTPLQKTVSLYLFTYFYIFIFTTVLGYRKKLSRKYKEFPYTLSTHLWATPINILRWYSIFILLWATIEIVVCHSLLQWTTFCQTSPPWPARLGWPHMAWFSFIELDKAVIRLTSFLWLWFVCLPSDASRNTPSYLGSSYLGHGISLHSCSSKAQPLLLTLDEGYLLTAAAPDLQRGVAPLHSPERTQPLLLGRGVAPPSCRP